jgi:hypothetical protein
MLETVAAGTLHISTFGTPGVIIGQRCISPIRAAGRDIRVSPIGERCAFLHGAFRDFTTLYPKASTYAAPDKTKNDSGTNNRSFGPLHTTLLDEFGLTPF